MLYPVEIVLKSFLPLELEEGMLFVNRISVGVPEEFIELWELDYIPENAEEFMAKFGAPIELLIIDNVGDIIATQNEIGLLEDNNQELYEMSLDDVNYILKEYEGNVYIEIDEQGMEQGVISPIFVENLIILHYYNYEEE